MPDVLNETFQTIKEGIENTNPLLKTRWRGVNNALFGGFAFNTNVLIAGASGHGKSYYLNMLMQDFLNPAINGNYPNPFKILHFGFEMSAVSEMIRRVSSLSKISYQDIMGFQRKLSDREFELVKDKLRALKDNPIYFVENPVSRYKMYDIIYKFQKKFPNHKLIITIDHTLLLHEEVGETEIEALSGLGKMMIEVRKEFGSLAIMLGQLNANIESERRLDPGNPAMHYPTKSDIHGSKQMYHACDIVSVVHQPAKLHLEFYGKRNIPTENLVAYHILKHRHGEEGLSLLRNNLRVGEFEDWNVQTPSIGYNFANN